MKSQPVSSKWLFAVKTLFRSRFKHALHLTFLSILQVCAISAADDLNVALQKGLLEEEANHDLPAAIQAYQNVIAQFDRDRKTAATAIFRLAECYRKQGKTAEAKAQYERVIREFSDQTQLVELSRAALGQGAKAVFPTRTPSVNADPPGTIIVDDSEAVFQGKWTKSATAWPGTYGSSYSIVVPVKTAPTAIATFTPKIPAPGKYNVYVRHVAGINRTVDARWKIVFDGGEEITSVNQQTNSGQWLRIASNKPFAAGKKGYVQLANQSSDVEAASVDGGRVIIADAVRFVPTENDFGEARNLFNGQDLAGWVGDPAYWSVKEGAITVQTPVDAQPNVNTCLVWKGSEVSDFELRFLFKTKTIKGSTMPYGGVVYRGHRGRDWDVNGYECRLSIVGDNIGMLTSRERMGVISFTQKVVVRDMGGLDKVYVQGDLDSPAELFKKIKRDDWNECVIRAEGNHFTHSINGQIVAELTDENEKKRWNSGLLALELNTGSKPAAFLQFKDIQLVALSPIKSVTSTAIPSNPVFTAAPAGTIVIDDTQAIFDGRWTSATSSRDKWGESYRFTNVSGDKQPTATATYTPNFPAAGNYHVEVFYPSGENRSPRAQWIIQYDGGKETIPVDQQRDGGTWVRIAENKHFAAGNKGFAQLSSNISDHSEPPGGFANYVIMADAVRFVPSMEKTADLPVPAVQGNATPVATPSNENEIIVDNMQAQIVGAWVMGRSGTFYGANYHFKGKGRGDAYVSFKPNLPLAGDYQVYEWHVGGANRASDAPFTIKCREGEKEVSVDQQINGSQWNLIGTFPFEAGTSGEVRLSDNIPIAGQMIMADAVRLVLVGAKTNAEAAIVPKKEKPVSAAIEKPNVSKAEVADASPDGVIVLDDTEAIFDGTWTLGAGSSGKYGDHYHYAPITDGAVATATATYRPNIPKAGNYHVEIFYPAGENRAEEAPWTLQFDGGKETVAVNQQFSGGQWVRIFADKPFAAGTNGFLQLRNDASILDDVVVADAVRFVPVGVKVDSMEAISIPVMKAISLEDTSAGIVVVDDTGAVFDGTWTSAGTSTVKFGSGYRFATSTAEETPTSVATYRLKVPRDGRYRVEIFYAAGPNRSTKTPWTIEAGPGRVTNTEIDQTTNGGQWVELTTDDFDTAHEIVVTLGNNTGATGSVVIADAVRLISAEKKSSANTPGNSEPIAHLRNPVEASGTIVVDNSDREASFTGKWTKSAGFSSDAYGENFLFATARPAADSTATFRPHIETAGKYNVDVWFVAGKNRSTNAQFKVEFDGGVENISINQQENGGQWVRLVEAKPFAAGDKGMVQISNNTPDGGVGSRVVVADAIRFVPVK